MAMGFLISFYGGALIGLAAVLLFLFNGRIMGVSGILSGIFESRQKDRDWRMAFVLGVLTGGLLILLLKPSAFNFGLERSIGSTVLAGILVGIGTRMANGCTSGHGVCGIGRLSLRSVFATLTFIAVGIIIVTTINRFFGGSV